MLLHADAAPITMLYSDYVAAEAVADEKHEYQGGRVVAMAGGTPEHSALAASVIAALVHGLRGQPCRVFSSDLRVRVEQTDLTTYPDASVVCGSLERVPQDPHAISNPIALVEVLSDSTEAYDRGDKAAQYRQIPSLREYLLISQREPRLELFRRLRPGHWEFCEAKAGQSMELSSLGVRLAVDEIYWNPLKT